MLKYTCENSEIKLVLCFMAQTADKLRLHWLIISKEMDNHTFQWVDNLSYILGVIANARWNQH